MDVAYKLPNIYITEEFPKRSNSTGTASIYNMYLRNIYDWTNIEEDIRPATSGSAFFIETLTRRAITDDSSAFQFMTRELTSTVIRNYLTSILEKIASLRDEKIFSKVAGSFDWDSFSVQDVINVIQLALECGAHLQARKLAAYGGNRFPENDVMQKYAKILGPTLVTDRNLPPDPAATADMNWLKNHNEEYRGQWVALRNGQLLGNAETRKDLLAQVNNPKENRILITQVY
jgi:hypothetical protein